MSAVAQVIEVRPEAAELHVADNIVASTAEIETKEQYRWMLWFGLPVLFMAIFTGVSFATESLWGVALAIACLIADIGILIWLCVTSDTNRLAAPEFAPRH